MKHLYCYFQLLPSRLKFLIVLPLLMATISCQPVLTALGEGPTSEPSATPTWPPPATVTPTVVLPTMPAPVPTPTATTAPVSMTTPLPTPMATPTPQTGYFGNSALGFSLFYPSGWEAEPDSTQLIARNDDPWVWMMAESGLVEPDDTVDDFILDRYEQVGGAENPTIIANTTTTLWDGNEARVIEFAETEDVPHARVTFVTRGRRVFLVLLAASEQTFIDYPNTFEAIAASMRVEEPRPYGISRQNALFLAGGQPRTMDPVQTGGSAGGYIGAIFSGLVMLDENLRVIPDLAESWELSEDGTVYTFHLRPNAFFHDGKPVTAHDVKFSWERAADPATDSDKTLTYLGDIVGVRAKFEGEADQISGVEVVDDYTLRVTIDAPKAYFLAKLTYPTSFIVDENNVQDADWEHHPNGTGPFRLVTWEDDELLVLERNDNFYQEPARLDHIVVTMYEGVSIRMYENDEIDLAGVSASNLERVTDPDNPLSSEYHTWPSLCTTRLIIDVTLPPFDDPLVRQAFSYAIDRQNLIDVVLNGMAQPAHTILPPGMPGYNPNIDGPTFDPDLARELLAASSYGDSELPEVTYTTSGLGNDLSGYDSALIDMWRTHLGVEVTVEQLEPISFISEVYDHHGQLVDLGWCADYPDPENFLDVLYHTGAQENLGNYSNPAVDDLLEQARSEPDVETRLALYHQVEQMIIDDTPDILLHHSHSRLLVKSYLKDYPLTPIGLALEWRAPYIDRESQAP